MTDSEAKLGRTCEEPLAVLQIIREKLRPLLLRAWSRSRAEAAQEARDQGMSPREHALYLAGFQRGWVAGALDVTRVSPEDLPNSGAPPEGGVH